MKKAILSFLKFYIFISKSVKETLLIWYKAQKIKVLKGIVPKI